MPIKKPTLKQFLFFLFSLWVIFVLWYARGYFYDEAPDQGRDAFYAGADRQIPDETNLAIAISGLNAPEGVNIIQHGRYVKSINDHSFDLNDHGESKKKLEAMPKLAFVGLQQADEIDCKLPIAIEYDEGHCTNPTKASKLLEHNKVLLNRYFDLYKIMDWQGYISSNGQLLINLNRLLAMQIRLLVAENKPEEAYQLWKDNFVFITRVIGQENTFIERAILLVIDGLNLNSLEFLLYSKPQIGISNSSELATLFNPQGLARYNLKGVMRAEYTFFDKELVAKKETAKTVHVEYIRNRIYRTHLEFLQKAQLPASKLRESQRELTDQYSYSAPTSLLRMILPNGLSWFLANQLINGSNRGLLLVESMHCKNAFMNLLNLSVKIHQQNIAETQVQAFLNKVGKTYDCPYTERPMSYDASKKTIYCDNPKTQARVAEVRL